MVYISTGNDRLRETQLVSDSAMSETPHGRSPRLSQRVYKVIQRLLSNQRMGQVYGNRFFTLERTVADGQFWPVSDCQLTGAYSVQQVPPAASLLSFPCGSARE